MAVSGSSGLDEDAEIDRGLGLICQVGLDAIEAAGAESHRQLVCQLAADAKPRCLLPKADLAEQSGLGNTSDCELYVAPILVDGVVSGAIELIQRPGSSPVAQRGHLQLMSTMAELAADYLRRRELAELRAYRRRAEVMEEFVDGLQGSLDVRQLGYYVANEGRRLIQCDRASLLLRNRRQVVLAAVSGVSRVDRRSNAMRSLERLANAFLAAGIDEPLEYPHDDSLAEALHTPIGEYVGLTQVKRFALLPLNVTGDQQRSERLGVLVCENYSDQRLDVTQAESVTRYASGALDNAMSLRRIPFSGLQRSLSSSTWYSRLRTMVKTMAACALLIGICLGLRYLPMDFRIAVEGTLRPTISRNLFAPVDGEVVELLVEHDDVVAAGDLLLRLTSPELDLEFQRVTGEFETAQKRLLAVESARVRIEPSVPNAMSRLSQLSAEEEELKILLAGKQRELKLLREDRRRLEIRSPIDGRVLTWDAARLLENRPVRRGQSLLVVADTAGDWIVDLSVPQRDVRYLTARVDSGHPVDISFTLATAPSTVFHGDVGTISSQVEWDAEAGERVIQVEATFDDATLTERRPGAVVAASIHCG